MSNSVTDQIALPVLGSNQLNPHKRGMQIEMLGPLLYQNQRPIKRVVCLPGSSGWDVEHFLSMGVEKVHAVERVKAIAEKLRTKWRDEPRVSVEQMSTAQFFSEARGRFDMVYLDYCANFTGMIRTDVRLLLRRELICKGYLVLAFLGSRENPDSLAELRMGAEDLRAIAGSEEPIPDDDDLERLRVLGVTGWLARMKTTRLDLGRSSARWVGLNHPRWFGYRTIGGAMMGVVVRVGDRIGARAGGRGSHWFNTRQTIRNALWQDPQVRWIERTQIPDSIKHGEGGRIDYQIAWVRAYYDEHHKTPSGDDMPFSPRSAGGANALVRAAGLCPRRAATEDEILEECRRIHHRNGTLSWRAMQDAGIATASRRYWHSVNVIREIVTGQPHRLLQGRGRLTYTECLVGQSFNRLTVIDLAPRDWRPTEIGWVCRCQCGRKRIASGSELRRGVAKECSTCARSHAQRSANRIKFAGFELSVNQWSDMTGLPRSTIRSRLEMNWTIERTLTTSIRKGWESRSSFDPRAWEAWEKRLAEGRPGPLPEGADQS